MFYTKEKLSLLMKYSRKIKVWLIIFLSIFIVTGFIFIFFSSYEKKVFFMVSGSFLLVAICIIEIFLLGKLKYSRLIISEYNYFLSNPNDEVCCEIINSDSNTITLSDSSCVYEIELKANDCVKRVFLSSLFENKFENNKKYKLLLCKNYIVGVRV